MMVCRVKQWAWFVFGLPVCVAASVVPGNDDWIEAVTARAVPAQTFQRISEYFDGKENTCGRLILRTNPEQRTGYYFILSLVDSTEQLPSGSTFRLNYRVNGVRDDFNYTFYHSNSSIDSSEVWLGLTGYANLAEGQSIVAWQITVNDPDGAVLAKRQSFLWE